MECSEEQVVHGDEWPPVDQWQQTWWHSCLACKALTIAQLPKLFLPRCLAFCRLNHASSVKICLIGNRTGIKLSILWKRENDHIRQKAYKLMYMRPTYRYTEYSVLYTEYWEDAVLTCTYWYCCSVRVAFKWNTISLFFGCWFKTHSIFDRLTWSVFVKWTLSSRTVFIALG